MDLPNTDVAKPTTTADCKKESREMGAKYEMLDSIIERLQEFRQAYGNIPVRCRLPGAIRKPSIIGIQLARNKESSGGNKMKIVDIIPKYDVDGLLIEKGSVNSVARDMAEIFVLFRNVAQSLVDMKGILANVTRGRMINTDEGETSMASFLASKFNHIYEQAKKIKDILVDFKGFDKRLRDVVKECISDNDYCVSYDHHIDIGMSDIEFAKDVTDGVGSKTSVQRMAIFLDVVAKINKEIDARKHRIKALEKRIAADPNTSESANAKLLIAKSNHIIETLAKRREYMNERFTALKESVLSNIDKMDESLRLSVKKD